jgi:hypothetical protein
MGQEPASLQDLIQRRQQTGFVGRHGEVARYQENLVLPVDDERRMFVFSIHGDAGVGKTYLTQHLRRLAARQGALTAYLDETVEDPAGAMSAIAGQFGGAGGRMAGFEKRAAAYWRRRHELESDPAAPDGIAAFLTTTARSRSAWPPRAASRSPGACSLRSIPARRPSSLTGLGPM